MKYRIKTHHVLIFCFLSALCGGNSGIVSAKLTMFSAAEGGSGTINCYLILPGNVKFFCKEQCKEEDILIKTDGVTANSDRYSITYKNGSSGRGILSVTINNMKKSDSGRYRCGLGKTLVPDSYWDFEIRVSDELLDKNAGFVRTHAEGETYRKPCFDKTNESRFFFCKDECKKEEDILIETDQKSFQRGRYGIEYSEGSVFGLYVTIEKVTKSDMGRYKCGYGRALSSDSSLTFSVIVLDAPTTSKPTTASATSFPSVFHETTAQQTATATTTSELTTASSTSVPSVFPKTTAQQTATALSSVHRPVYLLPLVVCVSLVGVSLLVVLLLLRYKWKKRRNVGQNNRRSTDGTNTELSVTYENWTPLCKGEDSIYQNFDPVNKKT